MKSHWSLGWWYPDSTPQPPHLWSCRRKCNTVYKSTSASPPRNRSQARHPIDQPQDNRCQHSPYPVSVSVGRAPGRRPRCCYGDGAVCTLVYSRCRRWGDSCTELAADSNAVWRWRWRHPGPDQPESVKHQSNRVTLYRALLTTEVKVSGCEIGLSRCFSPDFVTFDFANYQFNDVFCLLTWVLGAFS